MNMKNTSSLIFLLLLLSGCSGGNVSDSVNTDTDTDTDTDTGVTPDNVDELFDTGETTDVSYLPLLTLEQLKDWSGFEEDNVFHTYHKKPYIYHYVINPVNASTLASITTAKVTDFTITEDAVPLNPDVNFPILQKILGNPINLQTALVINTSGSMVLSDNAKAAFIAEIKAYVTAAKSSSDSAIANQVFTVWGFDGSATTGDGGIVEETNGFSSTAVAVNTALDTVLSKWLAGNYGVSGANHQYDAIVESVGRFEADGPFSTTLSYSDQVNGTNNDLNEWITPDFMDVSNMVLFSMGDSATNQFNPNYAVQALENQALVSYDTSVAATGNTSETVAVGKPLIYVVPAADISDADNVLENYATTTIYDESDDGFSFASAIVTAQTNSLSARLYTSNQHVVRFASSLRQGDTHVREFTTKTNDDEYGYTLTTPSFEVISTDPMPAPSAEITGDNNQYLSQGGTAAGYDYNAEYNSAVAYFDQITTFYPATRWTTTSYDSSSYTWTSTGVITENGDGSVTVSSGNTFPITITLTNTVLSDTFTVTVNESY